MNKNLKKILSVSLSLALLVSVAACSNDNTTDSSTSGSAASTESSSEAGKTTEEPKASAEEVKVDPSKDIFEAQLDDYEGHGTVLKYHTIGGEPEELQRVQDAINEYTSKHLNVTVDINFHDWGDYGSNLNTIINSGEPYDIAFGAGITGVAGFINNDIFADISELLPIAPNLKALIPDTVWKGVTRGDGVIFGVPAYKDSAATQYWVFDKALVDKYDIDYKNIVELDDLTPVLAKIKEAEPDRYPMMFDKNGVNSLNFDYEMMGGGVGVDFYNKDKKAVNIYKEERVVNRYKTLSDWYQKGYINPDANTLSEKPTGPGVEDIYSAQGFTGVENIWSAGHKAEVVINPRLGPIYTSGSIQGSYLVISAAAQNKEDAIKFIEWLNVDKYLRNLYAYGEEGVDYEMAEGKTNTIVRPAKDRKYDVPAYSQGQFMNLYVEEPNAEDQWIQVHKQNESAEQSSLLGFIFDDKEVKSEISALDNIVDKYSSTLNTGSGNAEEVLNQMYAEQEAAGIQKVIDEAQSQIDAFLAAKANSK